MLSIREVSSALQKILVMSENFLRLHDAYIFLVYNVAREGSRSRPSFIECFQQKGFSTLMKKLILTLLIALLAISLVACVTENGVTTDTSGDNTDGTSIQIESVEQSGETAPLSIQLTFNGTSLTTSEQDTGIRVEGGAFVITRGGSYELKGDLSGGQIKVSVPKTDEVELIFNNFTASCNVSAPLYVESAGKCVIFLAAGSVNTLTDAAVYRFDNPADDKPNACIYSADDLTIKGTGTLNVNGNFNNGIGCKNDLRIKDCTLNVTGVNNILKGNDSVEIENAKVKLSGGEDGIKSDTTDRTDKGYILIIAGSEVEINCTDDAIQASMSITVESGCSITGTCGGDVLNCPGTMNVADSAMQITEEP